MGEAREGLQLNFLIKQCLFKHSQYFDGRWSSIKRLWKILTKEIWTSKWRREYFIQDNIKTPFNRLIGCKLFGHRKVKGIEGDKTNETVKYCFNCYRKMSQNSV